MRRKILAAVGLGIILLVGAALLSRQPGPVPADSGTRPEISFEVGIPTAQEVRNMLAVYGNRVESAEREIRALRQDFEKAREEIRQNRREELSGLERLLRDFKGNVPKEESPAPTSPRFRTIEFEKRTGRSLHVPAGSFGEAVLLTGVFAPTSGEAMPVLLKLESALVGPQRSRIPLHGAFLIGKAQGDTNSRRAVVQLETLSVVSPEGTPFETRVNGWVTDDDGIQGLKGRYVWRADEIMALSSLTGGLSGGAEAMARRETTAQVTPLGGVQGTVTGDPVRFAGYRALSSAFGRLGEMVSRRLDEVVPAIYVPNSRRVTISFISGVTIEGIEAPRESASPYDGLDH